MDILSTKGWEDYELLDSGLGQRLERYGKYRLVRPDPQCIWLPHLSQTDWDSADAIFIKSTEDKGRWDVKDTIPSSWEITYKNLKFLAKLTPFKHTGIFPEQSIQWDWMGELIQRPTVNGQQKNVLNLFAYTGGATIAALAAGAKVTHVDASKPSITWARENAEASGLGSKPVRWILDDAIKFVEREIKRGVKYDGVILDPPIYGHGPGGERWNLMVDLPYLLDLCRKVLTDHPLFMLVNAYAVSASSLMLENLLKDCSSNLGGTVTCGELVLEESTGNRLLSTGIFGRWNSNE